MNKKTSSKAAGFGIASVWFGSHCGGGCAGCGNAEGCAEKDKEAKN